jgi:hypothetical protein
MPEKKERFIMIRPSLSTLCLVAPLTLIGVLSFAQTGCDGSFTSGSPATCTGTSGVPSSSHADGCGSGGADAGGADAGASGSDLGSNTSQCSPGCSGTTPLCDQGKCKTCSNTAGCSADAPVCDTSANGGSGQCQKIEVVAFYTPDPDMYDRAHAAYSRNANVWFPQTAKTEKFFTYESTTDWDRLKTITPAKGRIIMFLDNNSGDPAQQAGFQSYMQNGGAWIGCHVSAYNDDSSHWDWYFNEFLGCGHFATNTWQPTTAKLHVEDMAHPATNGIGSMFTSAPSEWYSWAVDLRTKSNIKILLSVDPSSFPLGTDPNQSWYNGYYPVAWTNTNYKMMYMNMGHEQMNYSTDQATSSTFDSPTQNKIYINAFKWLGGAM